MDAVHWVDAPVVRPSLLTPSDRTGSACLRRTLFTHVRNDAYRV